MAIILINLKRCHLQTNNQERLIFVNKNWPNNPKVGSFPTNLVKLVEVNVKLKEHGRSLKDLLIEMKLWTCKILFIYYCFLFFHFDIYLHSFFSHNGIFLTKYVKSKLFIFKPNIRLINNNIYFVD